MQPECQGLLSLALNAFILAQALYRNHMLIISRIDHDHTLR
jgi:hypothetical protein